MNAYFFRTSVVRLICTCIVGVWGCATQQPQPSTVAADGASESPKIENSGSLSAEQYFEEVVRELRGQPQNEQRYWRRVEDRMLDVTQRYPNYSLAYYNLGVAYERLGRSADAAKAYDRAITLSPEFRPAYENLSALYAKQGYDRDALKTLRSLVAKDASAVKARVILADYYYHKKQYEAAEQLCVEALTYEPTNLGAYCVLAKSSAERGKDSKNSSTGISRVQGK